MISVWNRPADVDINNVWTEFTAGNTERFHIRHLSEDCKEQCLELTLKVVLEEDPIIQALDVSSDPTSVESLKAWIEMYLCQNITYGCFLKRHDEDDALVAVDILHVKTIRDKFPRLNEVHGAAFKLFLKYIKTVERRMWHIKRNRVVKFLTSFGLVTKPEYRKLDIEKNMIRLRKRIAKELRIRVIASVFIGSELQSAAKKNKYKVLYEFNARSMKQCGLNVSSVNVFPIKIMGVTYNHPPKAPLAPADEEGASEENRFVAEPSAASGIITIEIS